MDINIEKRLKKISGAISGAITNLESKEATKHAKLYYEFIRNVNTDIDKIAKNTPFNKDQIYLVKNYLFLQKHDLAVGHTYFAPDLCIAQSWQRLAYDSHNIKPHDLTLIAHELKEMELITQGMSQIDAHDYVCTHYPELNYQKQAEKYYNDLKIKLDKHPKNAGAIVYYKNIKKNKIKNHVKLKHEHDEDER